MACTEGKDLDFAVRVWLCKDALAQELVPKYIRDQLLQDGVISEEDVERIEHEKTTCDKSRALLACLLLEAPEKVALLSRALDEVYPALLRMINDTPVSSKDRADFLLHVSHPHVGNDKNHKDALSEKRDELLTELRGQLENAYTNGLKLVFPIPWDGDISMETNEFFSECSFLHVDELQRLNEFNVNNKSSYQWLSLTGTKSQNTKRILLEGEPGTGKSVLCQKLALDWASGQNKELSERYDLLLYFPSGAMEENISISVKENILPEDSSLSVTEVCCLLLDPGVQKKTLVLVDGYDELGNTEYIDKIWHRRSTSDCTMIIASRPGFSQKHSKVIQARYTAGGLTKFGADSYIDTYIHRFSSAGELIRRSLSAFSSLVINIRKNPLLLTLFLMVVDDSTDTGHIPSSKTQLLEEIVEVVIKRGMLKCEGADEQHVQQCMEELEEVSFHSLFQQSDQKLPQWNHDYQPAKILCQMGLLFCMKSKHKLKSTTHVGFAHRTLQEYFAAKYIATLETSKYPEVIEKLDILQHQYIFVFISGLMRNSAQKVDRMTVLYRKIIKDLEKLAPTQKHKYDFHDRKLGWHNLTHLLLECIGESNEVPVGLDYTSLDRAIPKCVCCSNHCMFCLKAIALLTKHQIPVDCAAVVSEKSIRFLGEVRGLQKFIVRAFTESNVCLALQNLMLNCRSIKHLFVYLLGQNPGDIEPNTEQELMLLCKNHDSIETLVWTFVNPMTKVKEVPKSLPYILFNLGGKALTHLVLNGCVFDDEIAHYLADFIADATELRNIWLSRCLMLTTNPCLVKALKDKKEHLEHVYLEGIMDSRSHTIRNQRASHPMGTNLPVPMLGLFESGRVKTIQITHQKIESDILFVKALKVNHSLEVLCLHNVALELNSYTKKALCAAVSSPKLKQICLRGVVAKSSNLQDIVGSMTMVEQLDLSRNTMEDEHLPSIVSSLGKLANLRELHLESCNLSHASLPQLEPLLKSGHITILSLAHNSLLTEVPHIENVRKLFALGSTLSHVVISLELFSMFIGKTLAACWASRGEPLNVTVITAQKDDDVTNDILKLLPSHVSFKRLSPYRYDTDRTASNLHPYIRHQHFTGRNTDPSCFEMTHVKRLLDQRIHGRDMNVKFRLKENMKGTSYELD